MRILEVIGYTYDKRFPELAISKCGLSIVANDIVEGLSKNNEVYLLTHARTDGYELEYTICRHTWKDFITNLTVLDVLHAVKAFFMESGTIKERIMKVYRMMDVGSFRKIVRTIRPDIIHIHGAGFDTRPYIEACMKNNWKFFLTLHGDGYSIPETDRRLCKYEESVIRRMISKHWYISTVSSGTKRSLVRRLDIGTEESNMIEVVLNGTKRVKLMPKEDHSERNIICVGNIKNNKNQVQVIEAISLMPKEYQRFVHLYLCGAVYDNINIADISNMCLFPQNIHHLGFLTKEELDLVWQKSDINVVASKVEGFGLSIIEGFMRGIPTVTFSDLDAVIDLYSDKAMITVDSRSADELAKGIMRAFEKKWDSREIVNWGERFNLDKTVEDYEALFLK